MYIDVDTIDYDTYAKEAKKKSLPAASFVLQPQPK
ncbi:MAG: hypothetical protein QOH31_2059 [Verrucomicrobiota bacterium]|jgi:hypothetical protein